MRKEERLRKQQKSKRNRQNGHVNAVKKNIIENSQPIRINGRIYFGHKEGKTVARLT